MAHGPLVVVFFFFFSVKKYWNFACFPMKMWVLTVKITDYCSAIVNCLLSGLLPVSFIVSLVPLI